MYAKVDCELLDSSVWAEDARTRLVWITLLLMADQDGIVRATLPGIAHRARVSVNATRKALDLFQQPDANSRTPANEGRRIEQIPGGYIILNYPIYRNKGDAQRERELTRERVRKYRERSLAPRNAPVTLGNAGNAPLRHAEATTEATTNNGPGSSRAQEEEDKRKENDATPCSSLGAEMQTAVEEEQQKRLSPSELMKLSLPERRAALEAAMDGRQAQVADLSQACFTAFGTDKPLPGWLEMYPEEEVRQTIQTCIEGGKRSPTYAAAILKRRKREGYPVDPGRTGPRPETPEEVAKRVAQWRM